MAFQAADAARSNLKYPSCGSISRDRDVRKVPAAEDYYYYYYYSVATRGCCQCSKQWPSRKNAKEVSDELQSLLCASRWEAQEIMKVIVASSVFKFQYSQATTSYIVLLIASINRPSEI